MPEQQRIEKSKSETKREDVQKSAVPKSQEELDKLKAETDELLEAIDEALGEELLANSQEFVKNFIQKGASDPRVIALSLVSV